MVSDSDSQLDSQLNSYSDVGYETGKFKSDSLVKLITLKVKIPIVRASSQT